MPRSIVNQACRGVGVRSLLLAALISFPLNAQFFTRAPMWQHEILPVLEQNCVKCHGGEQTMAGLDLTKFDSVLQGGISGPAITPGHPEMSLLWTMIDSGKMPIGKELGAAEKQLINAWIVNGRFPSKEKLDEDRASSKITPEARAFWSFKKPIKGAPPEVQNGDQVITPIDAFVLAQLEEKGWKLQPEADRRTLIRRAYFDLIGLPPSPEEVKTFVNDQSPDAYAKLIDHLLESPHYGERWGRHWLDVGGYSDSVGDAGDAFRPVSYKYRNYVIEAFNKNKPFDQFVIEQLAGDQLVNYKPGTRPTPDQMEALTATGFTRLTADITDNQSIYQVDKWFDALQKSTETSTKAFLGLTIGCARCHDHKFDPILQADYYRLTASFHAAYDTSNWLATNLRNDPWPSRYILDMPKEESEAWIKQTEDKKERGVSGNARYFARTLALVRKQIANGVQLGSLLDYLGDAVIPKDGFTDDDLKVMYEEGGRELSNEQLYEIFPQLGREAEEIASAKEAEIEPNFVWALWDMAREPAPTYLLLRGNYLTPGPVVEPGVLAVLEDPNDPFVFPNPAEHPEWNHSGRRLTLAKWLTQPDHPLTSRVFVNRLWQFHFGEGIVTSVDDFGKMGARPTHPELLDWLAVDFVESGWDIKRMHRQIMLSAVYRQSSQEHPEQMAADPSDKLLWRKAPLRLDAEVLRDSMLSVSGTLNKQMFGEFDAIKEAEDGQYLPDEDEAPRNRRSLYLAQSRTRPVGFLHAFDMPTMTQDSVSKRFRSTRPSQALVLLNNPLVRSTSKALADRALEENRGQLDGALERVFELAYSRAATEQELAAARAVVASAEDEQQALRLFVQAMLGANDFLYSY
ncbi:MAG: PSD1 and planctomycete cytochrome C domain-containing protein [Acidobacteria bacterium]|nr:PSD1 and planctomycete cytochrome C domain-containing protein [Acidobacteriota bacterium]MDA1237085.1 PSD1 and planctomycete cytochrome C domain-containing protein [Acidobacteriota bacterium]